MHRRLRSERLRSGTCRRACGLTSSVPPSAAGSFFVPRRRPVARWFSDGFRVESTLDKEAAMALARVVTFDGVDSDRIAQMQREMEGNERPDNVPATEIIILHDPDTDKSLAIV